jgi:thymidine phosphorylase
MTTGAGATGAAALGHAAAAPALVVAAASGLLVISQVRALGALDRKLEQGRENAREAVETLIGLEVEQDADETPEDHP